MSRKFFRTVVQVVVLTEDTPYEYASLEGLDYDITDGDAVGEVEVVESAEVTAKEMADLLRKVRSEPGFFRLDDEGNELDFDPEARDEWAVIHTPTGEEVMGELPSEGAAITWLHNAIASGNLQPANIDEYAIEKSEIS